MKISRIICVIPARYESTRFPGKPLALICGKPMIQRVWERAKKVKLIDEVIIATDDKRIFDKAVSFGAKAVMTSPECKSGTDRIAQAVRNIKCSIVINLQGDEPLISPDIISNTIKRILKDTQAVVSTPVCLVDETENLSDTNSAKVVFDKNHYALYFSRSIIPNSTRYEKSKAGLYYKHIGLYVYKSDFLKKFVKLKESSLENTEKLEQLRILENGYKIKVVIVKKENSVPVDRPEDIKAVEKIIKMKGERL